MEEEPISGEMWAWNDDYDSGRRLRRLFRSVVEDRYSGRPMPPGFDLLIDPVREEVRCDEAEFLNFFCHEIFHQGSYYAQTVSHVPLLVALATDDRVPARRRLGLVDLLFDIATGADNRRAESWPERSPFDDDPAVVAAAKAAVGGHVPVLLDRWAAECPAVQLVLAAVAVTFPTPRTHAALTARLAGFLDRFADDSHTAHLVRFILTMSSGSEIAILAAIEDFPEPRGRGPRADAPLLLRATHVLRARLRQVHWDIAESEARL